MEEFWFESAGARLFAVAEGAGPVAVFLHGGMASHVACLPLVRPLAARFRVVAPDLRGSGASWDAGPLAFDQLADDVAALLDQLGVARAVVGGVSGGSGVALRFALRHPERAAGLVLVQPVYGGAALGLTAAQQEILGRLDAVASRALAEGVAVLRPLYAGLPEPMREKALALLDGFDAASVVATSSFLASGSQPFAAAADLRALSLPSVLIRGDDPLHPAEVSDLYAAHLPECTVLPAATADVPAAIAHFCDRCGL